MRPSPLALWHTRNVSKIPFMLVNIVLYSAIVHRGEEHKGWFETVNGTLPGYFRPVSGPQSCGTQGQSNVHKHSHRDIKWGVLGGQGDRGSSLQKLGSEERSGPLWGTKQLSESVTVLTLREQESLIKRRQMGSVDKKIGHKRIYEQLAKFS